MALPTQPVTVSRTASYSGVSRDCSGPLPGDGATGSVLQYERAFVPITWSKATPSDPTFRWRDLAYEIRESQVAPGSSYRHLMHCVEWINGVPTPTKITASYFLLSAFGVGRGWHPWFTTRGESSDAAKQIAKKLYQQVQKASVNFDLGVTLGEGKETLQYLLTAGRKIVSAARHVKHGRFDKAMRALRGKDGIQPTPKGVSRSKTFASNWLEYQFAVVPIVNDAYEFAEYMAGRALNEMFDAQRFTARAACFYESVEDTGNGTYTRRTLNLVKRDTFLCQRAGRSEFEQLMRELKLDNLASTAWEVAPLSWVVDAFVNIGNVLDSMAAFAEWEVRKGISASRLRWYEYSLLAYSTDTAEATGARMDSVIKYGRSTSPTWPTAVSLEVSLPTNPGQWISFISLLRVTMRD